MRNHNPDADARTVGDVCRAICLPALLAFIIISNCTTTKDEEEGRGEKQQGVALNHYHYRERVGHGKRGRWVVVSHTNR